MSNSEKELDVDNDKKSAEFSFQLGWKICSKFGTEVGMHDERFERIQRQNLNFPSNSEAD